MGNKSQFEEKVRLPETAPPDWLVEHWSVSRVKDVLNGKFVPKSNAERRLPSENGEKLWKLGKELPSTKACVPEELTPGLPRLSYEEGLGWIAEYWYYYVHAGLGLSAYPEPKFYIRIRIDSGELLVMKKLTDETRFKPSWLDIWAPWTHEKELNYLADCEELMCDLNPNSDQINWLQAQWLEAHPVEYAQVLVFSSNMSEAAVRQLLSPDRCPERRILVPLWMKEMEKGVRLGSPALSAQCAQNLAAFGVPVSSQEEYHA